MYVLNQSAFKHALAKEGYRSGKELAERLKIHRNTVGAYLQGKGVLPEAFEQIIRALKLHPAEALIDIAEDADVDTISRIMPLVAALAQRLKDCSVFLFGSRAKRSAAKYSDFDLGIYSSRSLSHKEFRELVKVKDDYEEQLPYFVDLINLNSANSQFLAGIIDDLILLSGNYSDLIKLKAVVSKNGKLNTNKS